MAQVAGALDLIDERREMLEDMVSQICGESFVDVGTAMRFLRARKFNLEAAVASYKAYSAFREERGIDRLVGERDKREDEQFLRVMPHKFAGVDTKGRPLYIERTGRTNFKALIKEHGTEKMIVRHILQMEMLFEQTRKESRATGRYVEGVFFIMDLKGLGLNRTRHKSVQELLKTCSKLDKDFYPGIMARMFIVNPPSIFPTIWKFVQPMLGSSAKARITLAGNNFRKILLEVIPADQLPKEYGGSSEVTVPMLAVADDDDD